MAENKLLTRISLKYDTLANWSDSTKENKGANLVLNKGEVGFCEIPTGSTEATNAPTVLFKVGDGTHKFSELKWASALAADVYAWAKCSHVELDGEVLKFHNGDKENPVHTVDLSKFALDAHLGDVDTLTTTAKTAVGAINEHDAEIGNLANLSTENKGDLVTAINEVRQAVEVGGTGSVVTVRKDNENKYTVRQGDNDVAVSIEIADGTLTVKGENGLTGSGTFGANQAEDGTITLSHANTSDAANLVADGRKYVTGLTFDDYGHVTGYTTGTEADQDLSGYKVLQEVYTKEAAGAFEVVSKIEQNANGEVTVGTKTLDLSGYQEKGNYKTVQTAVSGKDLTGANVLGSLSQDTNGVITYTTRTLTAADLGLDTVMHFVGAYAAEPTKAFAGTANERDLDDGDVYLNTANATEYVYSGGKWYELGNESAAGSHALKTIKIEGIGYLTGGGTLEQDRTIDLTQATKDSINNALQSVKVLGKELTKTDNEITVAEAKTALGLDSAAYTNFETELGTVDTYIYGETSLGDNKAEITFEYPISNGEIRFGEFSVQGTDYTHVIADDGADGIQIDLSESTKASLEKADKSLNAKNLYINDDCAPEDNFWGIGLYNNDGGDYIGMFGFTTEDGIEVRQEKSHDCKIGLSETIKASLEKADKAILYDALAVTNDSEGNSK
jgi:hypothetical protein